MLSILGNGPIADRNGPLSVVGYGHKDFSSKSELPENLFIIECQYQMDVSPQKKFCSFSAFASAERVQDWAAIFIRRLGCLNVEKRVNNFKRVQADRIVLNALHTYQFFFQLKRWIEDKRD